jgi:hypothetical protein
MKKIVRKFSCSFRFYLKIKELKKSVEEHDKVMEIAASLVNQFVMPIRKIKQESSFSLKLTLNSFIYLLVFHSI